LIYASLDQVNGENYQNAVIQAEANIQATLQEANRAAAVAIQQADVCFEQKICLINGDQ